MPLYALTIFLSAFLLFQVQPVLARLILPWFGGSAGVWIVALVFFQTALLLGYLYAHGLVRWAGARRQAMIHGALLLASCALLPIIPGVHWRPAPGADPTWRILLLLTATVGLPYFLLSATTPLLQTWFVRRTGSHMPYRLFALSNAGSLLALLSYPFLVEPNLTSRSQAWVWSFAYVLFAGLAAAAGWLSREPLLPTQDRVWEHEPPTGPGLAQVLRWVALAACSSGLLLAVTNHLSANVAPIPLLWVLPLSLYLMTFIFTFEWPGSYRRRFALPLMFGALAGMTILTYWGEINLDLLWTIPGFLLGLFLCCFFCHGELCRSRPAPAYLTHFYLTVALGGAAGGAFVGLAAPRIFNTYLELPLGFVLCGFLGVAVLWGLDAPKAWSTVSRWSMRSAATGGVLALAGMIAWKEGRPDPSIRLRVRNFYGALEVEDEPTTSPNALRYLLHGVIEHGSQFLDPSRRSEPTSYYSESSGVAMAIRALQARGPLRMGVIGLGAGCLCAYGRPGDVLRLYEINPLMLQIASDQFTYYADTPADKQILLGDARLTLEAQFPQGFDLLVVDAFSGDAIPIHLLTEEAFATYFRHLKPNGVLAIHISNRYLDLEPVCATGIRSFRRHALVVEDDDDDQAGISGSNWMLACGDPAFFQLKPFEAADTHVPAVPVGLQPWTDQASNLIRILHR